MNEQDKKLLDDLIIGRVTPHIYAFSTGTVPDYLKIGDTYRPVSVRLNEWRRRFADLNLEYQTEATVNNNVYFRDYAVHRYLEDELEKIRLTPDVFPDAYYSREFFYGTDPSEVQAAIDDIRQSYESDETHSKYSYYDTAQRLAQTQHYKRGSVWSLRPNQQEVVNNFMSALKAGRPSLLMYAVMRFGKSFTALCCAQAMNAKTVLVVSAKADVRHEWKKNVEKSGNFEDFRFVDAEDLLANDTALLDIHSAGNVAVVFLTLQDLQGSNIKAKHAQVFKEQIDLLIVDETHFGARAASFGEVLRATSAQEESVLKADQALTSKLEDDIVDDTSAIQQIKAINAHVRLHLSGTPYRILMGSEFESEDVISFVQFSDIAKEQASWDHENLNKDGVEEWDNPYFGFPQMIRFAFTPSQSAIQKMNNLKDKGVRFALSALLQPCSIKEDKEQDLHKRFVHEKEILELLQAIDGSQEDQNLLGFLDYDKIKNGDMCRHMVMVLPFCASCDAMEALIQNHTHTFKNLGDYEILNISGVEAKRRFKTPDQVKARIAQCEKEDKKTLTLTVNRMLTGSTVEQWDTMIYLKDTSSPQEYDQAIFRLQNQYVRELSDGKHIIKENLKPQTLLVDFDPNRLFRMQEQKALIYNVNTDRSGNSNLIERIAEELSISPVITMNHNRIHQVEATDIIEAVSAYNNARSITDEVRDLPIDLSVLSDAELYKLMMSQSPFGSKEGLVVHAHEGEASDLAIDDPKDQSDERNKLHKDAQVLPVDLDNKKEIEDLAKRMQTYYQRILFYVFLTSTPIASLDEVIESLNLAENVRTAQNLGLNIYDLQLLRSVLNPFKLSAFDYKIHNISKLACDESLSPLERAITSLSKFNRMGSSEIITPMNVCDDMVAYLSEDELRQTVDKNQKLLDIASKSGEFAVALVKRLTDLGYKIEQIQDVIYSIPTSSIAYEFTRRFYELLGLNVNCIANNFNAYDLLKVKTDQGLVDYQKLKDILTQAKTFADITLQDKPEGGECVQFSAVIGNPPYQQEVAGNGRATPIYPSFIDFGAILGRNSILITPGRFLFNAGQTSKEWNSRMLQNPHFKVLHYAATSSSVFPGVDIKGGIAVTSHNTKTRVNPIGTFIPFKELESIQRKTQKCTKASLKDIVVSGVSYKFSDTVREEHPELLTRISASFDLRTNVFRNLSNLLFFDEPQSKDDVQILGLQGTSRVLKWINSRYLVTPENHEYYKVFVPKSNGSGALGEVLSTPIIGEPYIGATQTFISIGNFETQDEADAALKYIKTKFARVLLGILKTTQDNPKSTWEYVPLQYFTADSDIDWSQAIPEIDQQLYKKYGLTQDEIDFIESHAQAMD